MIVYASDNIADNGLNYIPDNVDRQIACETFPSDYTAATTLKSGGGVMLGEVVPTFTGPKDGPSGREVQLDATTISVDETGIVDFTALVDDDGSELVAVYPCDVAPILSIDLGANTVTLEGVYANVMASDDVALRDTDAQDGFYTVASASTTTNNTVIELNESLSNDTVAGYVIHGATKVTGPDGSIEMGAIPHRLNDADIIPVPTPTPTPTPTV